MGDAFYKGTLKELRQKATATLSMKDQLAGSLVLLKDPTPAILHEEVMKMPAYMEGMRSLTRQQLRDAFLEGVAKLCDKFEKAPVTEENLQEINALANVTDEAMKLLGQALGYRDIAGLSARVAAIQEGWLREQAQTHVLDVQGVLSAETELEQKVQSVTPQAAKFVRNLALVEWKGDSLTLAIESLPVLLELVGCACKNSACQGTEAALTQATQLLHITSKLSTVLETVEQPARLGPKMLRLPM